MLEHNIAGFDVLLFGDLRSHDLTFGEFVCRRGLSVCVARLRERTADCSKLEEKGFKVLTSNNIVTVDSPGQLVQLARKAKMVVTFTGSFGMFLKWRWPLRKVLGIPPVVNIPTGSDFSELLDESSKVGWFYRYFVGTCDLNFGWTYPNILKNIVRHRIKNLAFMRYPYWLPVVPREDKSNQRLHRLRYFHPSHLDFRITDPGAHRNSSKGNDRFLRAFVRALKDGLDAECVILDRGSDRQIARQMVQASGCAERFIWKEQPAREQLFREMSLADVVVDQFDVGGLGQIAIEAMAIGRPVMIYLHEGCSNIIYAKRPPVISARTEDEIYHQIMTHVDREGLRRVGSAAREWVYANHSWETCLDQFLFYYTLLTGHQMVDYGWNSD